MHILLLTWVALLKLFRSISETPIMDVLTIGINIYTLKKLLHSKLTTKMYIYTSGTRDWDLWISDKNNGPWTQIANGSFPDPGLTQWNVPLTVVTPTGYDIPAGQVSDTPLVIYVY